VFRLFGWMLVLATVVVAGREALVVAAQPQALWLEEYVPALAGDRGQGLIAPSRASEWVSDPRITQGLIGNCVDESVSPLTNIREACDQAIEVGLRAAPASSELWFARARLYAAQGILDQPLAESLARSNATGPREGWIAAERLPFALRLEQFLPESLMDEIGGDVALVLANRQLAGPLIETYIADPFLRESSWGVIEQFATLDQQERLIAWIRQAI